MAQTPANPHLFVSYAGGDRDRVLPVAEALEQAGARLWIDRQGIPGGVSYGPEIVGAIKGSGALLLMCSDAAFASRNVRQEIQLAWKHERPILPLLLEPVEIPEDLEYWLEGCQWIEVLDRSRDAWLPDVTRALAHFGHEVSVSDPHPARTAVASRPVNLPSPLTDLIGREAEVRAIGELLAANRLVTLTGPGGVGKTRLAIEAARVAAPTFPDGVEFVDLAPLSDPSLLLPTVATALGVQGSAAGSVGGALAGALKGRRVLLLLDNLEQVVEAAPDIAALLSTCPDLAVLATSRSRLAVRGEHAVPVEPLPVPDAVNSAGLASSPAVALFVERACEARSGFDPDDGDLAAIAAICRRVDGLPLAIELAAARTSLLPPAKLLGHLAQTLPALTSGSRDLPTRQRTLRDAIAWSYDLLSAEEQQLFCWLAVFVGGCTFDAAEGVLSARSGEQIDALGGIASLVDKSLLWRETGWEGEPRYRMLEIVREFALERLRERGESALVRDAHAACFLALAEQDAPRMPWSVQIDWLKRLDDDHGNLRATFEWLRESGAAEKLVRLAGACAPYWHARGYIREGWLRMSEALGVAGSEPTPAKGRALNWAGQLAITMGDLPSAAELGRQAVAIWRKVGDPYGQAAALHIAGMAEEHQLQWESAAAMFEEELKLWRELDERFGVAITLTLLGGVAFGQGDVGRARALEGEAATLLLDLGERRLAALADWYLGLFAAAEGQHAESARHFRDSLAVLVEVGDAVWLFKPLVGLAAEALAADRVRLSAELLGAADHLLQSMGARLLPFDRPGYERATRGARTALGDELFAAAYEAGSAMTPDDLLITANTIVAATKVASEGTPSDRAGDERRTGVR